MWKIASVTVKLTDDKTGKDESLTWGYEGTKAPEDFLQMILFEVSALIAVRNPTANGKPAYMPAAPRAAKNRPARSINKGKSK